jgi:hypothetical protein
MSDDKRAPRQPWYRMRSARWCSDDAIQLLPLDAKGALAELTNRCHLSSDDGTLIVCGQPIGPSTLDGTTQNERAALKNLSRILRVSTGKARKTIGKLMETGAIAVNSDGVFYSPLLADEREISRIAAEKGRNGGNPHERERVARLKLAVNNEVNPRGRGRGRDQNLEGRGRGQQQSNSTQTTAGPPVPKDVFPHVPRPLNDEFRLKLGDITPDELIAFYRRVTAAWKDRRSSINENDFVFWRREWDEWRGTSSTKRKTGLRLDGLRHFANAPSAERTAVND